MIIAVDFDGTIVEHRYPKIGKEIPFAIQTLRTLIKEGHQLILWSVREGALLQEALDWCHERGVDFYAANMDEDASYITMVTRQGLIKRTPLSQFRNIRKGGLNAIALNEDDALVWCHLTGGEDELIVATHDGAAIHFSEAGARAMGRTGHGVRVIKLRDGDYVVGVGVCRPGATVLTVTEDGKGRRSLIDDYRITKRGGLGIRNYTRGGVAGIKIVDDTDDLILISQDGILIRMHANDINVQSRYGSGVRVMRLIGEDKVAVLARVDRDATAETAKPEDDGETDPTPEELEAIAAAEAAEEAAEDAAPDTEGEDEE